MNQAKPDYWRLQSLLPLQAVVFDMDGLLLDTERVFQQILFDTCQQMGFQMTDALHLSLIGHPREVNDRQLCQYFGPGFNIDVYHQQSTQAFDQRCQQQVPLKPGALELLEYLQQKQIPVALATSTARAQAEQHLAKADILHLLPVRVTRTEVKQGKPHPESYLQAAGLLGIQPAQALALEDSYNGVRSAQAAGFNTVMIPDLLPVTDEMASLCYDIQPDLWQILHALRD